MRKPGSVDIPYGWVEIHDKLRKIFHGPVILAGGALRDLDNRKPHKDLDFFVGVADTSAYNINELSKAIIGTFDNVSWRASEELDGYENCTVRSYNLKMVINCTYESSAVQIMITDLKTVSCRAIVEGFDWSICQIAWDGEFLYASGQYVEDCLNKCITYLHDEEPSKGSWNHLERIRQKYGHWRVSVCNY